jgi:peptidoglycan hydrolase-like protein with peptidoglycan-binding domain
MRPPLPSSARRLLSTVLTTLVLLAAPLVAVTLTSAPAQAGGSSTVLSYGDRGPRVVRLQRYLHVRPTSGFYGPITRAAVRRWQARHHRPVTGRAGRVLWHAVTGHTSQAADRSRPASRSGDRGSSLNWRALARCESGGNPRAVNPSGYYGLYQFSRSTWRSVGGHGLPSRASSAEQTRRARILFSRTGARSWPHCGPRLFS